MIFNRDGFHVGTISDLTWTGLRIKRSGAIPTLTDEDGQTVYCFGSDRRTNDLSDFSGGIKYVMANENAISGGLRELDEESLGVFNIQDIPEGEYRDSNIPIIFDMNLLIMFIEVVGSKKAYIKAFKGKYDLALIEEAKIRASSRGRYGSSAVKYVKPKSEMKHINWFSVDQIRSNILKGKFYWLIVPALVEYFQFDFNTPEEADALAKAKIPDDEPRYMPNPNPYTAEFASKLPPRRRY